MYDSNSFIAESISNEIGRSQHPQPGAEMLKSQTYAVRLASNAISRPSKQNILRAQQHKNNSPNRQQLSPSKSQHQAPSQQFQKTEPQQFLKYYEENLLLKKKQQQMVREMKILKHKMAQKDNTARMFVQQELKGLAGGKKSQWDKKYPKPAGRGKSSNRNLQTNKVQHLLEIIDHYKTKLITAEDEITNLKRQKFLLQQDNKLKDKRYSAITEEKPENSTFNQEMSMADKLKRNIRELELQKEKNKSYELAIKGLQAKIRAGETKIQEIDVLRAQNRTLEEQLLRLTSLPNFNNVIDQADQQKNMKEIENKLKLTNEKYNKLEERFIKTDADVKILQNRLIEAQYTNNTLQEENKELRKQSINNHILLRLNNQPQLLQEVFFEIEKRKTRPEREKQPQNAKYKIEKLILEKQELAKQLMNHQVRVQSLEENMRERERLGQLQKQQAVSSIPQPKTTGKQGVLYQGDVSCFSEQTTNIPLGSNYFDLFLGQVTLMESAVSSMTGISNASNPLILATVDFYNHNTESSKLTQGCRCNLQSQFFFRVAEDDFFFKFLQKGTLKIEIWASEGSKHHNLGKATIDLKHLLTRSKPRVSPVIESSATLHLGSRVLGSINFSMRMRMPIYDQAQRVREGTGSVFESKQESVIRRLVVQIDEGRGFGDKSNTFVYYPFRLEDHYTRTSKGNNPSWNHIKMLEIPYDNDFKNYLRKGELQFVIFDDNAVAVDDRNLDVGSACLSLAPLLQGKQIKQRLEIKKGNQRKGTIDVKIFWYEAEQDSQLIQLGSTKQLGPQAVHEELQAFMRQYNVDAEKVFRLIDDNRTGVISYEEFQNWLFKNSAKKFTGEVVSAYYKGFKEPLNHKNFIARVEKEYSEVVASKKESEGVVAGLGFINQMLKLNSTQIKKPTLQQFLQGKNLLQVVQSIETDRQGYVSRQQLQSYLDKHGLEAEIPGDRVKLMDYLRRHQKLKLSLHDI